jgi:hypothetical protein
MSYLVKEATVENDHFQQTGNARDELIARVRRQILAGTYDTDHKLDVCIEKLLQTFQTVSSESDTI